MHNEGESSQKIQELAHQLEQISKQVKTTIDRAINKSSQSDKKFLLAQPEPKKIETESIFSQLEAADGRIEKDLIDIAKWGQETRDLLVKLKAEVA